ncbi:MAG: recombinase family protein [Bacillota bacterium]
MQYCIYLRKSRADIEAEARGEGETLVRHEHALLDLAKRQKLNITEIYREIVSGETISSRPVMQQLLNEVEQGVWTGVLVMEVERLARGDTIDQGIVAQTFKYSNTKIITPMKTYDPNNEYDEEYFEFGLFMSRREYKTINRRLQRGRLTSVQEGKYCGTKPPYGYIRKKLEKQKGFTLEINPEQADVVKLIFELYTKGELQPDGSYKRLGVSLIVRKLNDMKIPPMKGDVWVTSTIQGILQNPVYIGKIRWNSRPAVKKMVDGQMSKERPRAKKEDWVLVDGLHESIIDNETWELAQDYYTQNAPSPVPTRYKTVNPLSGIIVCGVCGRRMVRRPYGGKYPDSIMCPVTSCSNISSQLTFVEERLLQSLRAWLEKYILNWGTKEAANNSVLIDVKKKAVKKLEEELKSSEKQMSSLHDLLEQGVYTTEKFLERSKVLTERINMLQKDKNTLLEDMKNESLRAESQKAFIPKVEKLLELYNTTDNAALKNKWLKEVLEKAVYIKTVKGRWHNRPDDFELELFPRLPR